MSDSQKGRLQELKWIAAAKRERPQIAASFARVLGCAPADILFLNHAETQRMWHWIDSKVGPAGVEVPDRASAIEFVRAGLGHIEGEVVLISRLSRGDFGAVVLVADQVMSHLESLLAAEHENLTFVARDGSFGALLGIEEGIRPDLPRWVQVWHDIES
jgi:hypothetical protein